MINLFHRQRKDFIGYFPEIFSFWKKLLEQTVCVVALSSLPCCTRIGKIYSHPCFFLKLFELKEFFTIVNRGKMGPSLQLTHAR
jgi:hypothetical protein